MRLRLMTDYECHAIWEILPDGVRNLSPRDLPISPGLAARIEEWQRAYDATMVADDPAASGFASAEEERAFEATGRELWRALQGELGPSHEVSYFSQTEGRELTGLA
ncbi:MAG TPA: hypothetical protein VKZ63_20205 [Kofleriaceae bacterium]|nr:hypothetical protein [Kofleriaceae bacterium]